MAMGKRKRHRQPPLWVEATRLATGPSHPFYQRLNQILAKHGFDEFVEASCQGFYSARVGRPSLAPAVYFRLLLIGYFEGIDSERGIAWRVADSMALREFLGYALTEATPDHSTISRNRRLIDLPTHQQVFIWVLQVLAKEKLLKGETLGIDATTLEANAALRSIVRRDTGESYQEFLTRLAQASGIETPTQEDLARLDRKRQGKGSNADWEHPHDPDARITKMKDGRTHLAHKAEHAVDLESGAVVAVTVQPADRGDTTSVEETIQEAMDVLADVSEDEEAAEQLGDEVLSEIVADKGYHSNAVLTGRARVGIRTYVSEPDRGRRNWRDKLAERKATYANRRRIRGERGGRLLRLRGERVERSFAHCYETGGMRRTHLRGHQNIAKRLLVHAAGFNLSLVLRRLLGFGKPRRVQDAVRRLFVLVGELLVWFWALIRAWCADPLDADSHSAIYRLSWPRRLQTDLQSAGVPSATGS
jgi:transposase